MRTNRDLKFGSHQKNGEDFVYSAQAAAVNLAKIKRSRLQELLEQDPVLAVLSGRDPNGSNAAADGRMPQHIIWARGLFDPPRLEACQLFHVGDGLTDIPALVGVHHQGSRTDLLPNDRAAPDIILQIPSHFDLEVCPAFRQRVVA